MPNLVPFAVIHIGVSVALAAMLALVYRRLQRAEFFVYFALFWVAVGVNLAVSQVALPLLVGVPEASWAGPLLKAVSVFLIPFYPCLMVCAGLSVGATLSRQNVDKCLAVVCVAGVALAAADFALGPIPGLPQFRPILAGAGVLFFVGRLAARGPGNTGATHTGLVVVSALYGMHNLLLGFGFYGAVTYSPWAAAAGILFQFALMLVLAFDTVGRAGEASLEAQESGRRFHSLLQSVGMAGLIVNRDGRVEFCNGWLTEALGPIHAAGHSWLDFFVPETEREKVRDLYNTGLATGQWPAICEYSILSANGHELLMQWYHTPLRDKSGAIAGAACLGVDLSQRRLLEKQAGQAQRMETLGRMAGGVAHDFNNHLTVINGYADLLLGSLPEGEILAQVKAIRTSGELAATLTAQLLTFSRKRRVEPVRISLNESISKTFGILRRLIREDVAIALDLAPGLGLTIADPGQLDHVVLNLALNAGDAITGPGTIRISTRNFSGRGEGVATGGTEFVVLAVEDSGSGMDEWTRRRIFEPFFTTKAEGKGTGLGLATVHGAVTQAGGWIEVVSETGKGSVFSAYLPRVEGSSANEPEAVPLVEAAVKPAAILLVEDQEGVRNFSAMALEQKGYEVLKAAGGEEALEMAGRNGCGIALLVTDVVMPGMSGDELARRLQESRPGLATLFVSGHTFERQIAQFENGAVTEFLPKPFTAAQLCESVARLLKGANGLGYSATA